MHARRETRLVFGAQRLLQKRCQSDGRGRLALGRARAGNAGRRQRRWRKRSDALLQRQFCRLWLAKAVVIDDASDAVVGTAAAVAVQAHAHGGTVDGHGDGGRGCIGGG